MSLRHSANLPFRLLDALEPRVLFASTRIAIIGDFSSDVQTAPTRDVSNLVKSWSPDAVVTVGDNNYPDGAASTIDANVGQWYRQFISPYKGSYGTGSPDGVNHFWPALGNHDWNTPGAKPYLDYFTLPGNERYYAVTQGNVGIFVVDSESQEPDGTSSTSIQANWLKAALAASTAQWKLVVFHRPPYTSGGEGNNAGMRWPFAQWGATAVIAGHDHDYERLDEGGFPYFVDGLGGESIVGFSTTTAGSQVRYGGDYGAMRVDASDTAITFQFITRSNALIDTYTIGTVVPPAAPTNLVASAAGAARVNLNWTDNATDETGYRIERAVATGASTFAATAGTTRVPRGVAKHGGGGGGASPTFTEIAAAPADATSFADTSNLAPSTQYLYRIRATNAGGDSAYSNTASATTAAAPVTGALVAAGSTWRYLDNGSNQGTAWRARGFTDTAWKTGAAQLGYGDGDEATVVGYGPDASAKYVTTYFRKSINVADPSSIAALSLELVRDDGAVVYLNGTEVYRSNMPTGTIGYTTLASTTIGGADETAWQPAASIAPSLLVAGNNVIAVEVHQSDLASSDISFDLRLTATLAAAAAPPAPATTTVSGSIARLFDWNLRSTTPTPDPVDGDLNNDVSSRNDVLSRG